MAEDMTFLPRKDILSFEEIEKVCRTFCELGVNKIRITGGEPLVRKNVISLFEKLAKMPQLQELCLTTNGSKLTELAKPLKDAGVKRINISLDSLQPERFKAMTRFGKLDAVLAGIDAAIDAGFEGIKINSVLMKNYNLDELVDLSRYAIEKQIDISFIEEMPLGDVSSHHRNAEFVSSAEIRDLLSKHMELTSLGKAQDNAGPSKYWQVKGEKSRIGFISPHSENFCGSCNRVRVSASGRLLLCLGNEHSLNLRDILRRETSEENSYPEDSSLRNAIEQALLIKPEKHHFDLEEAPQILRFMNATGG